MAIFNFVISKYHNFPYLSKFHLHPGLNLSLYIIRVISNLDFTSFLQLVLKNPRTIYIYIFQFYSSRNNNIVFDEFLKLSELKFLAIDDITTMIILKLTTFSLSLPSYNLETI